MREVIVNITDDGGLNCTEFESLIPEIAVNGNLVNSPYPICTSDKNTYELTTTINGSGYTYRWMKDKYLEVSSTSSYLLPGHIGGSGTYTVTVWNASKCLVKSEPLVVSIEEAPAVPVILGTQIVREGEDRKYKVKDATNDINYRWIIPFGYDLGVGYFDTDTTITLKIGTTSSILRVVATNQGSSNACASAEGRLDIEVRASYGVDVFPTVASNGTPLWITPKNMEINAVAVINAVGESYAYKGDRVLSTQHPLKSGVQMQITVTGLSSGHYFIVFYGRERGEGDREGENIPYTGREVVHTEHIVIKN